MKAEGVVPKLSARYFSTSGIGQLCWLCQWSQDHQSRWWSRDGRWLNDGWSMSFGSIFVHVILFYCLCKLSEIYLFMLIYLYSLYLIFSQFLPYSALPWLHVPKIPIVLRRKPQSQNQPPWFLTLTSYFLTHTAKPILSSAPILNSVFFPLGSWLLPLNQVCLRVIRVTLYALRITHYAIRPTPLESTL